MAVGGPPSGSRLGGEIRLVIVESPDRAAPLVGALDVADIGAWMWVEAENALYFSPRVLNLLGLPLDPSGDLLARFIRCVHPEDQSMVRRLLERESPAGAFVLRYRFTPPNGPLRWIEDRGRVERDTSGRLLRQGGAMRDATREMGQEQETAESNARLEALINAMPFAVWGRTGLDYTVTHQNPVSISRWGDLRGTSTDQMPREVAQFWRARMAEVMAGHIIKSRREYVWGDRREVLDEIIAPVVVDDEVTGAVGVAIDVTKEERTRKFHELLADIAAEFAKQSVDASGASLDSALERIGRFFDAGSASIAEITDDTRVVIRHVWRDPATTVSSPETTFDGRRIPRFLDRYAANKSVVIGSLDELPPDASERAFLTALGVHSFAAVPARHSDGALVVLSVAARRGEHIAWEPDTTALLRLAVTLLSGVLARLRAESDQRAVERRMQEAQKLESLGVLAGGIAHDFNNLLTAILGNASLLRAEHSDSAAMTGPLEQIEAAAKRAAELCRQMLAYAGRGRFALQLLDINAMLRESDSLLRVTLPNKAMLELALSRDLPAVLADLAQLRQLVMNLLINAGEAIGDSDGTITIRTGTRRWTSKELAGTVFNPQLPEGEYVSLSITDTGEGMTPEITARMFEPFFTTKFTGRGLGLSAVVGIVRAHKGALRVESRVGHGSTFELLLPAQAGAATAAPAPLLQSVIAGAPWRSSGTILVVDDEFGIRDLVRSVLERVGFTVILQEDGRLGVDAFRAQADDIRLVLVDLTMPGLDGRETLAAIREVRPDVPAIMMSGYTLADLAKSSAHAFLQKPFTPNTLRAIVRRALGED